MKINFCALFNAWSVNCRRVFVLFLMHLWKRPQRMFTRLSIARYNWHRIQFYKIVLFRFVWSRDALQRKEERASRYERRWAKTQLLYCFSFSKNPSILVLSYDPVGTIVFNQSGSWEREVVKENSSLPSWPGPKRFIAFDTFSNDSFFVFVCCIMRLRHILQYPNLSTLQK